MGLSDYVPLLKGSDVCYDPLLSSLIINFYAYEGPPPLLHDSLVF